MRLKIAPAAVGFVAVRWIAKHISRIIIRYEMLAIFSYGIRAVREKHIRRELPETLCVGYVRSVMSLAP